MRDQWGMSNVLKVSLQATIYSLHGRGWSRRRIARELGIDRETVGRYLLLAKPAISTFRPPAKALGERANANPWPKRPHGR
jgi:transposase